MFKSWVRSYHIGNRFLMNFSGGFFRLYDQDIIDGSKIAKY